MMQITQYLRQQINEAAQAKFLRLRHLNHFPIDSPHIHAVYMSLVEPEVSNAIKTLVQAKALGWLEQNRRGEMRVHAEPGNETSKYWEILFDFGVAKPSVNTWTETHKIQIRLDHPLYWQIAAWAHRCNEVDADRNRCNSFIESLNQDCNTPGQWNTVFPDFVALLPPQVAAEVSKMKKRSPIPRKISMSFVREHREFVAEKLATAMLLPDEHPKIWVT